MMVEASMVNQRWLLTLTSGSYLCGKALKRVLTMSTPLPSDWAVKGPDWPGFRMFPGAPNVRKGGNLVRVPPRAPYYRRSGASPPLTWA